MRKNNDDGDFCVEEKKTPISVQCRKLPKAQYDSELEKSIDSSTTNSTVALQVGRKLATETSTPKLKLSK